MSKELATVSEPFITRRDALGNIRRVLFSEFKRQCCPSGVSDGAALSFMRACDVLGAIPEVKDIELAIMKGKPVLVIREAMYLKTLRRRYPNAVFKDGIRGPDGKRKAMNAKPEADDIGWSEVYDGPGGTLLGRFEGVRREWDRGKDPDSAWARQGNHMLLVRMRCHNCKRIVPLEIPEPGPDAPVDVELVDEGSLEVEPAVLGVADEGEEPPLDVAAEEVPEEAAPGAVMPPATTEGPETPAVPAENPASAEESPAGEAPAAEDPWREEAPKPAVKPAMTDEQLRLELAGEAKRVFGEGQGGYQRFLAWAGKKHGTDVKSLKGLIADLRASAESSLEELRRMKDGELVGYTS